MELLQRTDIENQREKVFELLNPIFDEIRDIEDKVVRSVAATVLGRSPDLSDRDRFAISFHEIDPLKYYLVFDGIVLGTVERNMNYVEFKPNPKFQ